MLLMFSLVKLRNYCSFFFRKICLLKQNDKIIKNNIYIFVINLLYKLKLNFIIRRFNIQFLYHVDNLYFYEDFKIQQQFNIKPIILNCYVIYKHQKQKNIEEEDMKKEDKYINTDIIFNTDMKFNIDNVIKKYDYKVPLIMLFTNEKINMENLYKIEISLFKNNKIIKVEYYWDNILYENLNNII